MVGVSWKDIYIFIFEKFPTFFPWIIFDGLDRWGRVMLDQFVQGCFLRPMTNDDQTPVL